MGGIKRRGISIIRSLFVGFLIVILALVVYRYSEAAVYAYEVCTLRTYTIEYSDGDNTYTTTGSYWDCVACYVYLYDGSGGGGGGSGDNGDVDDPGGGGGGVTNPNNYDKNNDGYIDCYTNTVMRVSGLYIKSGCSEQRTYGPHNAWDITGVGVDGTTIYSVSNGIVLQVGKQTDPNTGEISGWGYYVKIKDNEGNIWIYARLKGTDFDPSGLGLSVNSKVIAGITPIGICDSSGNSTGPHLHLEYRVNNQKTCPDEKIGKC